MRHTTTFLLFSAAMMMCGCTDPIHEIDQSVDCNDVCNRYRSCYDQNYDVAACRNRCEGFVDGDGGNSDRADQCDMCLDARSCTTIAFSCQTQCAGILP
jgi:hypothetical protein